MGPVQIFNSLAEKKENMEAVHGDGYFNVTSVISQQHKSGNLGVIKKISINILKIDMGEHLL